MYVAEAARLLGIDGSGIQRYCAQGVLRAKRGRRTIAGRVYHVWVLDGADVRRFRALSKQVGRAGAAAARRNRKKRPG